MKKYLHDEAAIKHAMALTKIAIESGMLPVGDTAIDTAKYITDFHHKIVEELIGPKEDKE